MFVHQLCDWLCLCRCSPCCGPEKFRNILQEIKSHFWSYSKKMSGKTISDQVFFFVFVCCITQPVEVLHHLPAPNHPGPAPNRWSAQSGLQLLISPFAANWVTLHQLPAAPYELTLWGHWKSLGSSQEVRLEELSGPARGEGSSAGILTEPAAAVKDKELYL